MNGSTGVLLFSILCCSCAPKTPLPWRLLELGMTPVHMAMADGQWILVETNTSPHWLSPDTLTLEGAKLRRDMVSLPEISCGDLMRVPSSALPHSIVDALNWGPELTDRKDSLTLRWRCFDQRALAIWFENRIGAISPAKRGAEEAEWVRILQQAQPNSEAISARPYEKGQPIRLRILTVRADGTILNPDTVVMSFMYGDPSQVVTAIVPGLLKAGPGSEWAAWSTSQNAFGSQAHPDMGLKSHTPLRFSVWAD